MSRRWSLRGSLRGLVVVLAASLVPALAAPSVAGAAEPSLSLPEIKPVPVGQESWRSRPADDATRNAMTNDQSPRSVNPGSGTPSATSLSPSASWSVAGHTGDFSWSYPLRVPPAAGSLTPNLALSYQSSLVDGRTSAANNQPSWIGDGWDLSPGYVERTYGGCIEDGIADKGDLCWRNDNATATYSGKGGMLICCDSTPQKRWRLKDDDGSRIERFTGLGNGDNDGEHWKITTTNGTEYWFGSQTDAGSTWTIPVFGDDAGEPCHRPGSFDNSHCVQAWRWNLDKIVDRNGNMIRYFYTPETNHYAMNAKDSNAALYTRGGTLHRVDYGLHTAVNAPASGRVEFATADRCVPGSQCTHDKKDNWPDTALDQKCDAAPCKDKYWPTFWSTKRLASITTTVWKNGRYEPVERWELDQQFPNPGDGEKAALWLKGIKHTGLAGGGTIELPSVTFEGSQMPNRVYSITDGYAMLIRYRITGIISEAGGVTSINYAPAECSPGNLPANAWTNEKRCFPVTWSPQFHAERTDYFHKYVVERIVQSDMISSSAEQVTNYEYLDGAAWHWDTSEFAKDEKKTWSEFRGFKRMRIRNGAKNDPGMNPMTMTEERFYRGMAGDRIDRNDKTGAKQATVSDSVGGARTDHDWLEGFSYESTVYEREAPSQPGQDPPAVSRSVNDPVWKGPNATRGEYKSYLVSTGTQRAFTALGAGRWREVKSVTDYNDQGLPTQINDLGDVTTADDDRCSTTRYARNDGAWLLNLPSSADTVAVACGTTPRLPDDALTAGRFSYDSKGNLEKTEIAKNWAVRDNPEYVTTATARYDVHGRTTQTTDALGATSRMEFTPTTGGPVTSTKTISPATPTLPQGLIGTSTLDPAFGAPLVVTDQNNRTTEYAYDALGRTTKVWLPNRPRDDNQKGSVEYTYLVRRGAPTVITTTAIGPNGTPITSNELFDGLLRPRQKQGPAVGMREEAGRRPVSVEQGRLIVDTRYDTHGRAYKVTQPYFNSSAIDTNLWVASDTEVPGLTRTTFDGAGRSVQAIYQVGALDKWATTTSYGGDRIHTTPLAGGTATTVLSNARGQTTELRQYHGPTPTGSFDTTSYRYTKAGQLSEVTGPDGARWRYGYDMRGRKISTEDPDSGLAIMDYDNANRLISTKDGRGETLAVAYDALGRKTATHKGSLAGAKLAQWTFDTAAGGKGLPATATRFAGANAYTSTVESYTSMGAPNKSSVIIPAAEGLLAGTYTTSFGYGADGSLTGERYPAAGTVGQGGLGEESVNYGTDNWGRPSTTKTAEGVELVASTFYTRYGEVERLEHGTVGSRVWQSFYYETSTRRLARSIVDAEVAKPMQSDTQYTYDAAGNLTSVADLTLNQPNDIQCVRMDHLRRLTESWTAPRKDWTADRGCVAGPNQNELSGPAPYWHSYSYDPGGNRRTETQRTPQASVTRTYNYPVTGQPQPHTLRSVNSPAGTETLDYNTAGYTTKRVKPGSDETFTWDLEGHLESVVNTVTNQTTAFVYGADGGRLIRRDARGTTLFLPGQEVLLSATGGKPVVTRYYTHDGKTVAMRQGEGALTWLAGDHQGTAQISINSATKQVTRRRQLPFGAPRGDGVVVWPNDRGFVGGTMDSSTGLTHLGAREYDPTTGRFISVDPVMDLSDPQQMHGYAYANNNPVSSSDPTGLKVCDGVGGDWGCLPGEKPMPSMPSTPPPAGGGSGPSTGHPSTRDKKQQPAVKKKPPTKNEIAYFRTLGYKGSDAYTVEDAINWALDRPEGFTHYCQWVQELSPAECKSYLPPEPTTSELAHGLLDVAGWLPGLWGVGADVVNGAIYAAEGNDREALLSLMSLAPGGDVAKFTRGKKWCSFDADTEVLLADGTTRPISEIKVGDQVLAADPETGLRGARTVTAVMAHEDTVVELVTGNGTVTTTEDHRFYNATDKQWQRADILDSGDAVVTSDGSHLRIVGLRSGTEVVAQAFNLTVDELHTYFVVAGDTPVLVHNDCIPRGSGPAAGVIEVSSAYPSNKAFLNLVQNKKNGIEYVFDPVNERLLIGRPIDSNPWHSGHEKLVAAGDLDHTKALGGMMSGVDSKGRVIFTENSGHYGEHWSDASRQQFANFLSRNGIPSDHQKW